MPFSFKNDEIRILEFGLQICTRVPVEEIDEKMIMQQVKGRNMGFGDWLYIQTCNHDRTELYYSCIYMVERQDFQETKDDNQGNPYSAVATRWTLSEIQPWMELDKGWRMFSPPKKTKVA